MTTFISDKGGEVLEFSCSTKIYGSLKALEAMKARRVLVITDGFFSRNGTAQAVGARVPGAEVRIFDRVVPDPPLTLAAEGAALCREFKPELLLALGGGSAMDCAKAIRLAAGLPMTFLAIPTTSGSGAEVTAFSILTYHGVKYPLIDGELRPDGAILEDSLLEELPKSLIAQTGMDALSHCLEALAATGRSRFTDALAMEAAGILFQNLGRSYGGDKRVRGDLHQAATMAAMAFDNAGLGLCHGLAHALGGALHLPHGLICAAVLPSVLTYNQAAVLGQYAALSRRLGLAGAADTLAFRSLLAAIVRLRRSLELPDVLPPLEDVQAVAEAAMKDPCCKTNPVPVTKEGILNILKDVTR